MTERQLPIDQQTLGDRYELRRRLGVGGSARVYLAYDRLLHREVAIKILNADSDDRFRERFRREAHAVAALNHPNIVSIYDMGSSDDLDYLVMEYVPGANLKQILQQRGPLPEAEALDIAEQVTSGLAAAHRRGLIHRDVKPHNVLLNPEGHAKVVDFGIVHTTGLSRLTATNVVFGTAHYVSPEQAQHHQIDARSDLYSLGVVLYELLTGEVPFHGGSLVEIAMQHVHSQPVPLRQIRPGISPPVEAVVMKALAKNPDDRYQSATEMQKALQGARRRLQVPVADVTPAPVVREEVGTTRMPLSDAPSRRTAQAPLAGANRRRPGVAALPLLAALLLLLAAGAFGLSRAGDLFSSKKPNSSGSVAGTTHPPTPRPVKKAVHHIPPVVAAHRSPTSPPPTSTRVAPTSVPPATLPPTSPPATNSPPPTSIPRPKPVVVATHPPTLVPAATTIAVAVSNGNGSAGPRAVVRNFYEALNAQNFQGASQLWSPRMWSAGYSYQGDIVGRWQGHHITIQDIHTTSRDDAAGQATVAVTIKDVSGSPPSSTTYVGSWQLVRGSGGWLLDRPAF